jgi:hypothetical protein
VQIGAKPLRCNKKMRRYRATLHLKTQIGDPAQVDLGPVERRQADLPAFPLG